MSHPRRARRRLLALLGAGVAALLVGAGVLVSVPDWATPAGQGPLLGDPRSADPCALIDPAALARFGPAVPAPAYGNFNRCDVLVTSSGGNPRQDVALEFDKPGPVPVIRVPEKNGHCERTVLLADQNRIEITAKLLPPRSPADVCAMADAAADHAISAFGAGVIPRRSAPFDAASLARMDACAMLDPASLTRALGAGVRAPEAGFGNWVCRWDSSTSDLSIDVRFDRNEPRVPTATVAGQDFYITPEADGPDCVAEVRHRRTLDVNRAPIDEVVMVTVTGPRPADQLCGPGRELVQAAAAKLRLSR